MKDIILDTYKYKNQVFELPFHFLENVTTGGQNYVGLGD